jgi:hypothetical protein
VRGHHEIVPIRCHKQSGDVAFISVLDWRECTDIEVGSFLHTGADELDGDLHQEGGGEETLLPSLLHHLLRQHHQICEGRVQNHTGYRWISLSV